MNCSACNIEMEPLVSGIYQCPQCRKILKQKDEKAELEDVKKVNAGEFLEGEFFHKNASLNKKYEVCEKGIIINRTENRLFAVLICHSAYLKEEKYVRLSWWKSFQHAGMFKIYEKNVLNNLIITLDNINESFDDLWTWGGKYGKQEPKSKEAIEKEKYLELIKFRILENRTCPKCKKKWIKRNLIMNANIVAK